MNSTYKFSLIEKNAQEFWIKHNSFLTNTLAEDKPKFYCLTMFPYPSGNLHMGHLRTYVLGDIVNRYKRLLGFNVLHPMGWDAFGLPAENAAKLHKLSAKQWTYENIKSMKNQMLQLGIGYDWTREIITCDPSYYKHQQWFFLQLYKKGIAYRKNGFVNWDPVDQTVLANEQVIDGRGWRSNALVEIRETKQWYISVSDYANELYTALDKIDTWPAQLITMQKNWIGKSEGHEVTYLLSSPFHQYDSINVFTTRLETIMGIVSIILSPQHPISLILSATNEAIEQFIKQHTIVSEKRDKEPILGIKTILKAIHPITKAIIPVWISNFVKHDYASGSIGCAPAHDERDKEFAEKYNIDFTSVICAVSNTLINSGEFNSLNCFEARNAIFNKYNNSIKQKTYFRLRDWGVSRQRYWGCPIPVIMCDNCGIVPENEANLPILLPLKDDLQKENYATVCPQCSQKAYREMDTFDTFFESSWYYSRYICPEVDEMISPIVNKWLPVDYYIGGIEHATLHFLYARLIHKMMRDMFLGSVNHLDCAEPFKHVLAQGMILKDGVKMSKSKGNTVIPSDMTNKYGADSMRMFIVMAAPPQKSFDWNEGGLVGVYRFLTKVYNFSLSLSPITQTYVYEGSMSDTMSDIYEEMNLSLKNLEEAKFNTVATSCMKIFIKIQALSFDKELDNVYESFRILLLILHPIAPHITHELWINIGYGTDILKAHYLTTKETLFKNKETLVIQLNGKKIGVITTQLSINTENIIEILMTYKNIEKYLKDIKIRKVLYLPNKIVSITI